MSVFEKFYGEAKEITSEAEFRATAGPSRALWRHRDGRTLLMTGVSQHRVPAAVLDLVGHEFVKDRVPLDANVDIYVRSATAK